MLIKIDNKYRITSDLNQYILQRKIGDVWIGFIFSDNINHVIKEWFKIRTRTEENINSFQSLINYQDKLFNKLEELLKPLELVVKK